MMAVFLPCLHSPPPDYQPEDGACYPFLLFPYLTLIFFAIARTVYDVGTNFYQRSTDLIDLML